MTNSIGHNRSDPTLPQAPISPVVPQAPTAAVQLPPTSTEAPPIDSLESTPGVSPLTKANKESLTAPKAQPSLRSPQPLHQGKTVDPYGVKPNYQSAGLLHGSTNEARVEVAMSRPSQAGAFTQTQLAEMKILFSQPAVSAADFTGLQGMLTGPEQIAAFMGANFSWADTHPNQTETYSPVEMLQRGVGLCRDQHQFATFMLQQNGFEAHTVGYGAPGVHHAITTFRDENGWGIIEYGQVYYVNAATEAEALAAVIPGALKYWVYADSDDPNVSPGPVTRVIETKAGMALKGFANGAGKTGLKEGTTATIDEQFSSVQHVFNDNWSVDISAAHGDDPMLKDSFMGAVRYQLDDNTVLSLGGFSLPEAYSYTIGPRARQTVPVTAAFIGLAGDYDMADGTLNDIGSVTYDIDIDGRAAAVAAFSEGTFDTGVTAALSHVDVTTRAELAWKASEGVRLWSAGTAYLPVGDMAAHLVGEGTFSTLPMTFFAEAGVDYTHEKLALGLSLYAPIQTRTNLYADEPRAELSAAYAFSGGASVAAYASSGLESSSRQSVDIEASYKMFSLSAGVERGGISGDNGVGSHATDYRASVQVDLTAFFD